MEDRHVTADSAPQPARLEWRGSDALPPERAQALIGEGAPFEFTTEVFDGIERTETMIAFKTYSRHDLESVFSIGMN